MIKSKTLKIKARTDVIGLFDGFFANNRNRFFCEVEGRLINRIQLLFNAQKLKYPFLLLWFTGIAHIEKNLLEL